MKRFLAILPGLFLALVSCGEAASRGPIGRLINSVDASAGKKIEVEACFRSQRHGIALYDCDTPDRLLAAELTPEALVFEEGKALLAAGYAQWPPGSGVGIEVRVIGHIRRAEGQAPDVVFVVSRVANFRVVALHSLR